MSGPMPFISKVICLFVDMDRMIGKDFFKAGHTPTLLSAFLYFDLSFMVWYLLGPLAVQISADLHLTTQQRGLMVATPILAGAVLRLFMGLLADWASAETTSATIASARNMCTVIVQGVRLLDTTKDPIHPVKETSTRARNEMTVSLRSDLQNFKEYTNTAKIKKPMITPVMRLKYSIQVFTGLKSASTNTDSSFRSLSAVSPIPRARR